MINFVPKAKPGSRRFEFELQYLLQLDYADTEGTQALGHLTFYRQTQIFLETIAAFSPNPATRTRALGTIKRIIEWVASEEASGRVPYLPRDLFRSVYSQVPAFIRALKTTSESSFAKLEHDVTSVINAHMLDMAEVSRALELSGVKVPTLSEMRDDEAVTAAVVEALLGSEYPGRDELVRKILTSTGHEHLALRVA